MTAPPMPERTRLFVAMMRDGTFVRGRTVREYARLWGMTVDALQRNSSEASRIVRANMDAKEQEAKVLSDLDAASADLEDAKRVADDAEQIVKVATARVGVAKARADVAGIGGRTVKVQPVPPELPAPRPFWETDGRPVITVEAEGGEDE